MCYRGGRGIVPTDESTSIRNCGDAYDGIRPGRMIVKFRGWPRDMVMQMRLWHICVAEPPCEPRQIDLEHLSMSYRRGQPRKSMRMAMSRGRPRKSMTCQGSICRSQHRLSSGGAVRRSSLRCAPFGPPTVSCVLAPARTCLRQAPPTSRGRGLATSAVPHHLTDDMAMKTFTPEKRCKKTSFFSPFQKIQTNGVKSGQFLHRLVRSCGCLGQASGQVLHGHLHDSYRITLKISHLERWQ